MATEIRNKESIMDIFGTDKNEDGTPIQEVVEGGQVVAEIRNKESIMDIFGADKNEDGSPVKEVVSTND
jgi:hypothetical protein